MYTILPDRSYETTKLLQRSKGVFSKTRRTLTSPPQFRIDRLSAQEELTTTAFIERQCCNNNIDRNTTGTVIPTHNCNYWNSDADYASARDWKPFLIFYKGTLPCKHNYSKKHFPPDSSNGISPGSQYISDHRPCGVSPQQLDSVGLFFETAHGTSLSRLLNGSAGYRTYSEDSKRVQDGFTVFDLTTCRKQNTKTTIVIPNICLSFYSLNEKYAVLYTVSIIPFWNGGLSVIGPKKDCKTVIPF